METSISFADSGKDTRFFPSLRDFLIGQAPYRLPAHRMFQQSEVTIMWFNNGNNDCSCLWLIIIVILLFCCCNGSWGNNCCRDRDCDRDHDCDRRDSCC